MKTLLLTTCLIALVGAGSVRALAADAAPKKPTMEDRVADLEAYVTNGARQTNAPTALATSPGPGHNAWQMTSTALVLFMTLPGLALFYGGLVRKKNVLSVLAQCLGITGLVTILWWAFGYSVAFHSGNGKADFGSGHVDVGQFAFFIDLVEKRLPRLVRRSQFCTPVDALGNSHLFQII